MLYAIQSLKSEMKAHCEWCAMPLASLHAVPAALRGAIETISEWQRRKGSTKLWVKANGCAAFKVSSHDS